MADIKLYQIPRSILAREPKPILEIDFVEELQSQGFPAEQLESPQTLSLIGAVAARVAEGLGNTVKTNYGVLSVFDRNEMSEYQTLLEKYRMNPEPEPAAASEISATGKEVKGKKKKKKK